MNQPEPTVLVSDLAYEKHDTGFGHPEQPARIKAVLRALDRADLSKKFRKLAPRPPAAIGSMPQCLPFRELIGGA